jgi:hypothetical protein
MDREPFRFSILWISALLAERRKGILPDAFSATAYPLARPPCTLALPTAYRMGAVSGTIGP